MNIATMETILLVLLVADAVTLGALVLIQQGKGADVGAAFGSGGANTVFGSAGSASFLTRMTAWLSIGFFLIAFGLAYTAKERAAQIDDIGIPQVRESAPATVPEQPADAGEEQLTDEPDSVDSPIPDV